MRKIIFFGLLLFPLLKLAFAQESWLLLIDDPLYRQAEELFICNGVVPPYEELPLTAENLKSELLNLISRIDDSSQLMNLYDLVERLKLSFGNIKPLVELGLASGINTETDRFAQIPTYWGGEDNWVSGIGDNEPDDGRPLRNFIPFYDVLALPKLASLGFILQVGPWALHGEAELKKTCSALLQSDVFFWSIPENMDELDICNTSFNATINYYSPNFEVSFGRSKLHYGPGQYSTLSVSKTMPYFDYVRGRLRYEGFSLYTTVISLNPVISNMESEYLDYLYEKNLNPEPNAPFNGKIFKDRLKNYINIHFVWRPWPWLSLSFMQTNLVGGRPLDLADFNPFLIIHNNFDEGTYSCPILLAVSIVPFAGLRLSSDFLFYDAPVGDEINDPSTTPGAIALQGGFTLLSTPFFTLGPGRFRLDAEITYVDPYAYGKYYDLRKFTSRFLFLDHDAFPGRYWLDFPLGFYLGPDCLDIHAVLSYGQASDWEVSLGWQSTGKGEIDLYGYGDDTEYVSRPSSGLAPSGVAQWTHALSLGFFFKPLPELTVRLWYRLSLVFNRFDPDSRTNIEGVNHIFHYMGLACSFRFF